MARKVDLVVSEAMRDIESRREEGEDIHVTADVTDDGAILLDTASVPWRVPRPPEAPPPALRRPGGPTSTVDRLTRQAYVEQLWRSSYATSQIVDIVTTRWRVHESTVKADVALVQRKYLAQLDDADTIRSRKEQMRATLLDLAQEARAAGDRSTARYVYDKIIRLDGNYVTKIEATVTAQVGAAELQIDRIVQHLNEEGLRALEVVLLQLEAAGIIKPPELPSATTSAPALEAGSVIDASSVEVDGEGDDHDEDDGLD